MNLIDSVDFVLESDQIVCHQCYDMHSIGELRKEPGHVLPEPLGARAETCYFFCPCGFSKPIVYFNGHALILSDPHRASVVKVA